PYQGRVRVGCLSSYKNYLYRLYDTVLSRAYIETERLVFDDQFNQGGSIEGWLRFHDGSLLEFNETVVLRNQQIVKLRYAYQYQDETASLIFRYDNAPHYRSLPTFPDHKHVSDRVESAVAPDLNQVLYEIEQILFTVD
ncbi:MAG: DUF6516 family protein, partial [Chloroflexota bacterium]|nr:DUF6516 family protein [Chloroflexota bacterium]